MNYPILILCILISALHLFACGTGKKALQDRSKPFLLASLFLLYVTSAAVTLPLVSAGIILCFLGDVLLLMPGQRWLLAGLISFLAGWTCYTIVILTYSITVPLSPVLVVIVFAVWYLVGILSFRVLKNHLGMMLIPAFFYLIVVNTLAAAGTLFLITATGIPAALALAGGICVAVSDFALAYSIFVRPFKQKDLFVMSTYIFAQFCLIISFILVG